MTPLQTAAKLACVDIYPSITPNVFNWQFVINDVVCGVAIIDGYCYVVNQGTVDFAGWMQDINILPIEHPILGQLHSGFYSDLPELVSKLLTVIPKNINVICCGHSKGAAEAAILSALLKLANINIIQNYLFACPNAGQKELTDWLSHNIRGISYCNQSVHLSWFGDPVPDVPHSPYIAPYPHSVVTEYPSGFQWVLPTKWHSAKLYYDAIKKTTGESGLNSLQVPKIVIV